ELISGVPSTTRGRGYFRYAIGEDGDHYVRGEWGHDDNHAGGGHWNAVRDRRRQPSLSGARGTSGDSNVEEFDTAGGGSDDSGSGSGSGSGGSGGGGALDLGDL